MELILTRHGLPVRTEPSSDASGPPDPELSTAGHEQARRMAQWLADEEITTIYSSPLLRARQTAQPLADLFGLPVVVEDGLHEIDIGEDSYIPIEELQAGDPRAAMWRDVLADQSSELIASFRARVAATVRELIARHSGETIAAACHGGVVSAALADVLGLTQTFVFDVRYTSVTRIRASRTGRLSVRSVNDCGHLHPSLSGS